MVRSSLFIVISSRSYARSIILSVTRRGEIVTISSSCAKRFRDIFNFEKCAFNDTPFQRRNSRSFVSDKDRTVVSAYKCARALITVRYNAASSAVVDFPRAVTASRVSSGFLVFRGSYRWLTSATGMPEVIVPLRPVFLGSSGHRSQAERSARAIDEWETTRRGTTFESRVISLMRIKKHRPTEACARARARALSSRDPAGRIRNCAITCGIMQIASIRDNSRPQSK